MERDFSYQERNIPRLSRRIELAERRYDPEIDREYTIFQIGHEIRPIMHTSDWIFVLDEGCKIAEGVPEEIRKNKDVHEVYLE